MASPPLKMVLTAAAVVFILCNIGLTPARARSAAYKQATPLDKEQHLKGIWKRTVDEDTDHAHDHAHIDTESQSNCAITDHVLAHEFTELSEEMMLTDHEGELCHVEEEGAEHVHDILDGTDSSNLTCSSCTAIYDFVQELLLRLNVTTPCCLGDNSTCSTADIEGSKMIMTDPAKAYGYGFLMVLLISASSLIGIAFLPLLNKDSKCHGLYKYIYFLMIALGTSALFCDTILHLIPEAFGLHNHGPGESHAHHEEEEEDRSFLWKGIVIICGLYLFYLFEVTLNSMNSHSHEHHHHHQGIELQSSSDSGEPNTQREDVLSNTNVETPLTTEGTQKPCSSSPCLEPTLPHGVCRDKCSEELTMSVAILHPGQTSCPCEETQRAVSAENKKATYKTCTCSIQIKPLAWVIILGDAIHNFVDGLALGAAVSQSLSLGLSTTIAIVLHELPHELGDFAILLSTGLKWYVAILFNFVSSLTAVAGFFVGVAVGTSSSEANSWILAIAAGLFLYIALVDLLPELIHINEKGCTRLALILMANIGFVISFVILLVIAIYEDELNTLVTI